MLHVGRNVASVAAKVLIKIFINTFLSGKTARGSRILYESAKKCALRDKFCLFLPFYGVFRMFDLWYQNWFDTTILLRAFWTTETISRSFDMKSVYRKSWQRRVTPTLVVVSDLRTKRRTYSLLFLVISSFIRWWCAFTEVKKRHTLRFDRSLIVKLWRKWKKLWASPRFNTLRRLCWH